MNDNSNSRRRGLSLVWPAILLGTVGASGLWFWLALGDPAQVFLASALMALTAMLTLVWLSRLRATRRLHATLDAYADREIMRAKRRQARKNGQTISSRGFYSRRKMHARPHAQTR
jgi:hypothetical protein